MTEQKNNNNIQIWLIIALLVVIAIMGFFLGKSSSVNNISGTTEVPANYETVSLTVIDDKRCTDCPTDAIMEQLIQLPSLSTAEITRKDFSDEWVAEYLKENNITTLPLIVFSTNNFDTSKDPSGLDQSGKPMPSINTFLQVLPSNEFTLPVGSVFNPFEDRSERGYLQLDTTILADLKASSYIKGSADAQITWIEYSDLECPYCAKLSNSGTSEDLTEKYGAELNIMFNHFPLAFHDNAQIGAEILECVAEEKGIDTFYTLIKTIFKNENSSKSFIIDEAVALWASEDKINECLKSGKYTQKVKTQMANGTKLFGITGTPGNILINNETGEYEVISWAYPTEAFEEIIDKLLK